MLLEKSHVVQIRSSTSERSHIIFNDEQMALSNDAQQWDDPRAHYDQK